MKKAYLIDFIGFMIAKAKNISHLFSMAYVNSGNRWRNRQYHPHVHLIATSGGFDGQGQRWEHLQYLPYALLRRKWQWHLLRMVRQTLNTKAIDPLVDECFKKYPNGLVTNVQRGNVPSAYQSLARYVAKYVLSPPIAVRRIDRYDGK